MQLTPLKNQMALYFGRASGYDYGMMSRPPVKRIMLVVVAAIIGFGMGLALPLYAAPRDAWLALNAPGLLLSSPFVTPGVSVWIMPLSNGIAYAGVVACLTWAVSRAQRFRNRTST